MKKCTLEHHVIEYCQRNWGDDYSLLKLKQWLEPLINMTPCRDDLEGLAPKEYQFSCITQQEWHLEVLGKRLINGDPKSHLEWHLKLIYHLGQAYFRMTFNAGTEVPINVNQHCYSAVGKVYDSSLGLDDWVVPFSAALILQDYNGALELCEMNDSFIDADIFTASSADKQFDKAMLRLLKGVLHPESDIEALLKDAAQKVFDPQAIGSTRKGVDHRVEEVQYRYLPLISLIHAMYSSDRETLYPEKLKEALEDHKTYWMRNEPQHDNAYVSKQWMAMLITALASLAYHRWGLEPCVDTLYMPEWMVKGDISPEFKSKEEVFALAKTE
ncbi:Imm49 family immunity protein [Vibrio tubiashii]|uniref:Uncharacterized protein n=1 Tax=Vibrio tubiashii ATCC 19109 TaxID=1051646 RepID=F9T830_9VIBR|nr:Imm49 family immunity protein [Vibrio tubiashii]AIW12819.1 hypothetical protein IX91_01050 [Vibrio tubiashii ATCC 19109]EGU53118.1 hypothetical protein VITU9109_18333 [Vibrio tubiashii ATCC 19109]EIF05712.1 hypothetical protein VT1337_02315 [Vibrio tubiashii NCIMB 1337 = ATCC 19106]